MNESGVIDLRPMRGVLITPGLTANEPDRVEVHDKEPGEATDAWIRRAVGCDLFDVVVAPAGRIDIWVDDEGLLKELEPNMVASLMAADEQNFMERAYLDELARQLKLDDALKSRLEQQARPT